MSDIQNEKNELRNKVLSERQGIDEGAWKIKSETIIAKLIDLDSFERALLVHTYISMNERREVCTDALIEYLFKSKKSVAAPITNFSDNTLSHSMITNFKDLSSNKWGVREPNELIPVDTTKIDLVVVPMAAADRSGNRLGYGKGFYDGFLSQINSVKVGLIFKEFLFEEIPVEEFDVKLEIIVTDDEVIFT